jgi:hypothetical protein
MSHFNDVFEALMGQSPKDYLASMRHKVAVDLNSEVWRNLHDYRRNLVAAAVQHVEFIGYRSKFTVAERAEVKGWLRTHLVQTIDAAIHKVESDKRRSSLRSEGISVGGRYSIARGPVSMGSLAISPPRRRSSI